MEPPDWWAPVSAWHPGCGLNDIIKIPKEIVFPRALCAGWTGARGSKRKRSARLAGHGDVLTGRFNCV